VRAEFVKAIIVTPEPPGIPLGNSITAARWAGILGGLGHVAALENEWKDEPCDLLVALHARRSHASIERFRKAHPERPLIVALTGTDLYRDLAAADETRRSLEMATRIVALQEAGAEGLRDALRDKTRVIYQSAVAPARRAPPLENCFEACVLSHLRDVKDPLRAAEASRLLPAASRIQITHAGRALDPAWEERALAQQRGNPRYRWIGEQPHDAATELLARSRLLIVSSLMEGGANAIAEAVVCGIPVLCSAVPGNIGMLGSDYPGYFEVKNTQELARLLESAEANPDFLASLKERMNTLKPRFTPERESECWLRLLREIRAGVQ
jgi:putative glycosyltransferase (TIGR04348 family)